MTVACFCGCVFWSNDDLDVCPYCRTPVSVPQVTTRDAAQMKSEVEALIASHESGPS